MLYFIDFLNIVDMLIPFFLTIACMERKSSYFLKAA